MNGIENISQKIIDEARAKADIILKEADESSERILLEAREKADAEINEIAKAGKTKINDIEDRALLSAGIEAKKIIAGKKQALIAQAFDNALSHLLQLPAEKYIDLLSGLAIKAAGNKEKAEVLFNQNDQKYSKDVINAANKALGEEILTLASDTANIRGGLVLRRGKIETNCALEVIVRMLQEDISGEVAACLFGKGA